MIYNDRVYIAMGQDPEHGEGPGHMYAVDATQRGDISKTGAVWRNDEVNRGLATVSIYDNILYHCDLSGIFRAIDPETGKVLWKHDMGSAVWSSPYYVDGKVLMGDEDGHVVIFAAGQREEDPQHDRHGRLRLHHARGGQRRAVHQHAGKALRHPARRVVRREEGELKRSRRVGRVQRVPPLR